MIFLDLHIYDQLGSCSFCSIANNMFSKCENYSKDLSFSSITKSKYFYKDSISFRSTSSFIYCYSIFFINSPASFNLVNSSIFRASIFLLASSFWVIFSMFSYCFGISEFRFTFSIYDNFKEAIDLDYFLSIYWSFVEFFYLTDTFLSLLIDLYKFFKVTDIHTKFFSPFSSYLSDNM